MENELQILNNIEKNKGATQRDIAKSTGMSLGNVNILIKRLVKKGLLKIERLNTKTIRYILTPQGIKEKADATYNYIVYSYRLINEISTKIDRLTCSQTENNKMTIILFGEKDEINELIKNRLVHGNVECRQTCSTDEIKQIINVPIIETVDMAVLNHQSSVLIVVWNQDYAWKLADESISFINLLEIV